MSSSSSLGLGCLFFILCPKSILHPSPKFSGPQEEADLHGYQGLWLLVGCGRWEAQMRGRSSLLCLLCSSCVCAVLREVCFPLEHSFPGPCSLAQRASLTLFPPTASSGLGWASLPHYRSLNTSPLLSLQPCPSVTLPRCHLGSEVLRLQVLSPSQRDPAQ